MEGDKTAAILKALAEPRRMEIMTRVAQLQQGEGCTCGQVLEGMEIAQPTFAHHLAELIEAGLIEATPKGRCKLLRVNPNVAAGFLANLKKIFGE